jgi:uncharacterized membrane protein YidH (DUF202 family)
MTKLIAVLILSVSGVTVAAASSSFHGNLERGDSRQFAAPEIDPSSALTALTMLLGGVTVLRSRIAKK